jgi:NAD(P)-dependent dehydrogenase (short-subunit alcohol dehydrogenase family)
LHVTKDDTGEIGNGRATSIVLARQGAKVALLDNNVEWARETKRMIDAEGGTSEVIEVDVTNEESVKNAVAQTVKLFGTVHILVNVGRLPKSASANQTKDLSVGVGGVLGDATKVYFTLHLLRRMLLMMTRWIWRLGTET